MCVCCMGVAPFSDLMCMTYGCDPFLRSDVYAVYGCGPSLDLMYMLSLGTALLGSDVYAEFWVRPFLDLICMLIWVWLFLGSEFMVSLGLALFSCWVLSTAPFRTVHLHSFHCMCL
jgi:hypothetical protein